jgi:hypothetical protein
VYLSVQVLRKMGVRGADATALGQVTNRQDLPEAVKALATKALADAK